MKDISARRIKILLVEDNPGDARLVREALAAAGDEYNLDWVDRVSGAEERLAREQYDLVIVDLLLPPETRGILSFRRVHEQAPLIPKLVLTSLNDEALAVEAVQAGAQDYLFKGLIDGPSLIRAITYALERDRLVTELRALSLRDELTGLNNRRGFFFLAEQELKVARRTGRGCLLVFVDLDGMKQINDSNGHQEGDRALVGAAAILRETFRESDIIARLGGDEFTVLTIAAGEDSAAAVQERLRQAVTRHNARPDRSYALTLSCGVAQFDPTGAETLEDLLARADASLYEEKKNRRSGSNGAGKPDRTPTS